jgi:hypothetical protein
MLFLMSFRDLRKLLLLLSISLMLFDGRRSHILSRTLLSLAALAHILLEFCLVAAVLGELVGYVTTQAAAFSLN